MIIDRIVKNSNGAYTHDEAFKLEAEFAYSIMLAHYEEDCYRGRESQARREITPKTK